MTASELKATATEAPSMPTGEWDEMVSGAGRIRPAWRGLVGTLHTFPDGALAERAERAARQHDEMGVAYRLVERQGGEAQRPFDIIPMLLQGSEWAAIVTGLEQRARLLGAILGDLYGARRLVAEGKLPPALLYGNPRFLRPCSGLVPAGGTHLHAYAADLVRQPDGAWRVLADRLQAPSGIGFALQNRSILARTMPELFRAYSVRRIEPFFEAWQARLAALAPRRRRPPSIVVMTPGPFNAGFFEHVYLARQLGAVLVEGADLTVRDDRVFIKTLGSLQPVDVILRFMDDDYCDPLELRSTSVLGVAGLLQAVRAGKVVVANALGATVAETPAMRPFLPQLAQSLLGEALQLPSVETEWLGAPGALDRAARRLGEVTLRPAFATRREEQSFAEEVERLGGRLPEAVRRRPERFVAEARGPGSMIPVWTPSGMQPRPLTLRVFLFNDGDGYRAMPGGFVTVQQPREGAVVPLDPPTMSKDAWVLADEADELPAELLRNRAARVLLRPGADELRSRTADDLFWLGRYTERLDNMARVMRAAVMRVAVDQFGKGQRAEIDRLMRLLVGERIADARALEILHDARGLLYAIGEAASASPTLDEIFRAIQRIAQALRDRLSNDMWRVVQRLMREARDRLAAQGQDADRLIAALDNLVTAVAAFGGMASENMTRGSAWRFLDIGRRLERGVYGASVLREVAVGGLEGEGPLGLALELCDSSITYRSRYLGALQPGAVFTLLLTDEINPRAVAFQLRMIASHLSELGDAFGLVRHSPDLGLAEATLHAIRRSGVARLDADEPTPQLSFGFGDPRREAIVLLATTRANLLALSETITRIYFSHARLPHAVGYGVSSYEI